MEREKDHHLYHAIFAEKFNLQFIPAMICFLQRILRAIILRTWIRVHLQHLRLPVGGLLLRLLRPRHRLHAKRQDDQAPDALSLLRNAGENRIQLEVLYQVVPLRRVCWSHGVLRVFLQLPELDQRRWEELRALAIQLLTLRRSGSHKPCLHGDLHPGMVDCSPVVLLHPHYFVLPRMDVHLQRVEGLPHLPKSAGFLLLRTVLANLILNFSGCDHSCGVHKAVANDLFPAADRSSAG